MGSPARGDCVQCLVFPLNAPSLTRTISKACQPPAASGPCSPRGPASQQTAPSPQRGPRQPPAPPLPPCLLPKELAERKSRGNEQAGSGHFHEVRKGGQVQGERTACFSAEMRGNKCMGCQHKDAFKLTLTVTSSNVQQCFNPSETCSVAAPLCP